MKESYRERIPKNYYFMMLAKIAAMRSSCNSRPSGAIIVKNDRILSTGMSGTVSGCFQCSDKGKDYCFRRDNGTSDNDKYNTCKSIHSEVNALNYGSISTISLEGSEIYCTLQPCYLCLKQIASVGIRKVYFETKYESKNKERDKNWFSHFDEYNIEYKHLKVPKKWIELAYKEFLSKPTSIRRLESK